MAQDEQVLVIERKVYEQAGTFHGLNLDTKRYIEAIFDNSAPRFMPRSQAEHNPDYKQIIPYVIMGCDGKYLSYVRGKRAGETRLTGNRSIGIGGHINPVDDVSLLGFFESYLNAVDREVNEEIYLNTEHSDSIIGLLNDETNEVGRVHLGIVHFRQLKQPSVTKREQMITQMDFLTLEQLRAEAQNMETWSQLCLEGLENIESGKICIPDL